MTGNSVKIWEGDKIFAVLTGLTRNSENTKTGNMLGVSILPIAEKPSDSIKHKNDQAQCGGCALAAGTPGPWSCYVNPVALNSVWAATVKKKVSKLVDKFLQLNLTPVRLGTYGDPAFLPLRLLKKIIGNSGRRWTGYTHQWETCSPKYSAYMMASIDRTNSKADAIALGYRTYRILGELDTLDSDEIMCPHNSHGVQCCDCKLCSGNGIKAKNIAVRISGPKSKTSQYGSKEGN
jgi:hypothetical protein